jgi:hypothetical protein
MNSFSKALTLMKLVGYWNKLDSLYKENGMRFSLNFFIQAIGVVGQLANQFSNIIPPKAQAWVALALTTAQGVTGLLAHFSNPNGTPAAEPYTPK